MMTGKMFKGIQKDSGLTARLWCEAAGITFSKYHAIVYKSSPIARVDEETEKLARSFKPKKVVVEATSDFGVREVNKGKKLTAGQKAYQTRLANQAKREATPAKKEKAQRKPRASRRNSFEETGRILDRLLDHAETAMDQLRELTPKIREELETLQSNINLKQIVLGASDELVEEAGDTLNMVSGVLPHADHSTSLNGHA